MTSRISPLLASVVLCALASSCEAGGDVPVRRTERQIGMAISEAADGDYDAAFAAAKDIGVRVVSLKLDWDAIEKSPGKFETWVLEAANAFYPQHDVALSVRLATLDTVQNRIPADLRSRSFDDPVLIKRFCAFADYILTGLDRCKLAELSIGNEVDGVLGADPAAWAAYTRFAIAAREHIRKSHPRLPVGVSLMFAGATGPSRKRARTLNAKMDRVMVSYYPLDAAFKVRAPETVADDFARIVQLYPKQPISFVEVGYPSGAGCNSSPAAQAHFVESFFAGWDQHADRVPCATWVWQHDVPVETVEWAREYYGTTSPAFADYIATLGLRNRTGDAKPAWMQLEKEARRRARGTD